MQEKLHIRISSIGLTAIKAQTSELEYILLNELLFVEGKIEDFLLGYYFSSRGRVFNVRISKPVLENQESGYFYVNYSVGHYNACADIDPSGEEKMKITFSLRLNTGEMCLLGEYFPERDPDNF